MTKRMGAIVAAVCLVVVSAPPARADDVAVTMKDNGSKSFFYFFAAYRVIHVGDSVTWTNETTTGHTVKSFAGDPAPFGSTPSFAGTCEDDNNPLTPPPECMQQGAQYSFTFRKAGVYDYYCQAHNDISMRPDPHAKSDEQPCQMCGRIEVVLKPSPRPSTSKKPPTHSPTPSPSVTPTPTATPTKTPGSSASARPTESSSDVPIAGASNGGGGGRLALALVAIALLSGAAYATWRRFIAAR